MRVNVPIELAYAFLAVFARISGAFTFLPVPGLKGSVDAPRILIALVVTMSLFPSWPTPPANLRSAPVSGLLMLTASEAALGACVGLLINCVFEAFQFGAQALAQQAGFSYASTIDPTNDTDSGVLLILSQLLTSCFAIATGLDRALLKAFADSLETLLPGAFAPSLATAQAVTKLIAQTFEMGLRLALPAIAIFLVLDILLAVLSRLEQQLQLTTILFPVKTAGAIAVAAAAVAGLFPFYEHLENMALQAVRLLLRVAG